MGTHSKSYLECRTQHFQEGFDWLLSYSPAVGIAATQGFPQYLHLKPFVTRQTVSHWTHCRWDSSCDDFLSKQYTMPDLEKASENARL
jgi:hypothetical protein